MLPAALPAANVPENVVDVLSPPIDSVLAVVFEFVMVPEPDREPIVRVWLVPVPFMSRTAPEATVTGVVPLPI